MKDLTWWRANDLEGFLLWENDMRTNETKIKLFGVNTTWRRENAQLHLMNTISTVKHRVGNIMPWFFSVGLTGPLAHPCSCS